jgi:hypothetical protein
MKIGEVVAIQFTDHCTGCGNEIPSLVEFEVVGRIIYISKTEVRLSWWGNIDGSFDHNTEWVAIARSTIHKVRRFR